MTEAEIVEDVRASMDDLETANISGNSFGAWMVRVAEERRQAYSERNKANGQKGGRPRKSLLPTKDEIYAFAVEAGLDEGFAREWYELSIKERKGRDRDGNPIANWQAALTGYVTSRQLGGKR